MKYIFILISVLSLDIHATDESLFIGSITNVHSASVSHPNEQSDFHTILGCVKISNENYQKCNEKLKALMNSLTVSSKACNLLKKIENLYGTIELTFPTRTPTGAHWIKSRRMICIEADSIKDIGLFCSNLIWELCNAGNETLEIRLLLLGLCGGQDMYAFLSEATEYLTVCERNEILKEYFNIVIKIPEIKESIQQEFKRKGSISDLSDEYTSEYNNFMDYWFATHMKSVGRPVHSDLYRKQYQDFVHDYSVYGYYVVEGFDQAQFLTSWDEIGNDAESVIVSAFSQRSFDTAKAELRFFSKEQTEEVGQQLSDVLYERRMDQLIKFLIGLHTWSRRGRLVDTIL